MIVLSVIALVLALVAVVHFAGPGSRTASKQPPQPLDPFDPTSPANPLGMLNPANPLSPMWSPPSDTSSDDPHRHHAPGDAAPNHGHHHPSTPGDPVPDCGHHHSGHVDIPSDPGSFDAGSHSHH